MGLAEYNEKRRFDVTPEPEGKVAPVPGRLFIIQKHASSRLHYDFRLELDGVLLSWAVPKGPSYDPADERLAVHVEDHPVDYGSFEGVIPKGQYGGGTVVLWDRGTWEPTSDPKKGMAKGRLEFVLHGEKCQGGWILTRMGKPEAGHENWLLIKRNDDKASKDVDITAEQPLSVATGRSMDEVASDKDRVWSSREGEITPERPAVVVAVPGAKNGKMPASIGPELCTRVMAPPDGDEWIFEIKLDGYRALVRIEGGKARATSRSDRDWSKPFSPIIAHATSLSLTDAWLDGEVCVLRADGTSDFQALQNDLGAGRTGRLVYFAFDLLYLDGDDLRGSKLIDRKEALKTLLDRGPSGPIRYLDHVEGSGEAFFRQTCQLSLEGAIAKRADAAYRSARTKDWLKIQCIGREDFVIGGYTKPQGSRDGFGALLLGSWNEDKTLRYVGRVGTGFNSRSIADLMAQMAPSIVDESPFAAKIPGVRGATWVRPALVASVAFSQWTDEGQLRHPSFKGLRTDVAADSVSAPVPTDGRSARPTARRVKGRSGGEEAIVAGVRITSPDRVLWKETGVTKADLAEYYARHAAHIVPHLARRPLTMLRCPNGSAEMGPKGCFYQKHATNAVPSGLFPVDVKTGEEPYLYLEDVEGLLSLVQMGVLEIHPWGSRIDDLERPDRLIFDLDPAEGLPWERVAEAALVVKNQLTELGLDSWAKTTGGKGLHVCVPLQPAAAWDDAKQFCEDVANLLVKAEPKKYTSKLAKDRRTGKVLVDWLRNARGATAVSAWSTRARPGGPIAVPIRWEEVIRPPVVDVRTVDTRSENVWDGFYEADQALTPAILRAAKG